ncbi:MAG: hypothetical protein H6976_14910 [Gammaproteobacteria bacterium]|nr:hypothetical protein [Gammaproteobacteria bacterium]
MAGNKHPWRDVMSLDAWKKMLTLTQTAPTGTSAQDPLGKIFQKLKSYHQLEKQNQRVFPQRIEALKALETEAYHYLQEKLHGKYQKEKGHKGGNSVNPRSLAVRGRNNNNHVDTPPSLIAKETSINRWVYSLAQRARKKAGYLEELNKYLRTGKAYLGSYSAFLDYLKRKNKPSDDSELLSLVLGVKPEKWDPFHRPIELDISESNQELILKATHPNAISFAFIEWYTSQTKAHFFEWLEGHPICTLTKYLDANTPSPSPFEFGRVQYGSGSGVQEVSLKAGLLYAKPFKENNLELLLNTKGYSKNMSGEAYVWLQNGQLLIHPHCVGTFHHSSFDNGGKVRCAGTIDVKNGIIERLDNSSGHYRPSTRHFLTFLKILNEKKVLNPTADVRTHDLYGVDPKDDCQRIGLNPAAFLEQATKKSLTSYSVTGLANPFYKG